MNQKNYHDAELVGLSYTRDTQHLVLNFQLVNGGLAVIRCDGVTHFKLGEMSLQNVTSRLLLSSEREFHPDEIRSHINWACSRDGHEHAMTDARATHFVTEIRERRLTVLVLEPSIGAELVVVCKAVAHVDEVRVVDGHCSLRASSSGGVLGRRRLRLRNLHGRKRRRRRKGKVKSPAL